MTSLRILCFLLSIAAAAPALRAEVAIRSDFEGGSIGAVRQVAADHFRCAVKGEVDQDKRNRQASWYYFQIDGAAGREITIDLTELPGEYNYRPGNLAINGATRPFVSDDRETWTALPDAAVLWDANGNSLRLRFTPARSPAWIAHVPPYTARHLSKLVVDLKGNPHAAIAEIGKSAGGRSLLLFTVTNRASPDAGKKVLWLMARQHAWESGTSWAMDGAVRFLLKGDAAASGLRDRFIFKFFPMADPDGVARGGVRFNVHGFDVNRNWDTVDPKLMPEIAALRKAVLDWVDSGHRLDFFLSLHNTNNDYLEGPLTAAGPDHRRMVERFATLLSKDTFYDAKAPRDWPAGEVAKGRMDACQGLFHDRAIRTLLLEQNVQTNARLGRPAGSEDYRRFGAQLAASLAAAATGSGGVTYDAAQHTWTLTTGPVIYRLRQQDKAVVLDYFGPSGKAAWTRPPARGPHRWEISATAEGMHLDDRDWEIVEHHERAEGLTLVFRHAKAPLVVEALYGSHGDTGVVTRELRVTNRGSAPVRLQRLPSLYWRLPAGEYECSYLYGTWARERQFATEKLGPGRRSLISRYGRSTAEYAAWFGLRNRASGIQYAGQLAWSGNWELHFEQEGPHAGLERTPDLTVEMGLRNDFGGSVLLEAGKTLALPAAAFTVSPGDLDDAANQLHRYQRHYAIPRTRINRPLVTQFNSWYPLRIDFTEEQLRASVDVAKELGLESYVIDNGWFPRDANGKMLFGDWEADPKIFRQGMPEFARYVHSRGLKFGLWVELESAAFSSKVYREHPDWFLTYRGEPITSPQGPYLNFGKPEVRAWARGVVERLVKEYRVDWIKFDYNVNYGERFDASAGGVLYGHILGLYEFFDDIRRAYPQVIFENCSSGARRLDLGMIARSHTSWLSDNTTPIESVQLAHGCTLEFTPEVCNHWMVGDQRTGQVDLAKPEGWWDFMFRVPMNGQYGISSRVAEWTPALKKRAAENVALYKRLRGTIADADVYHLTPAPAHDRPTGWMALQYVTEDRRSSVVMAYRLASSEPREVLRLRGLEPERIYRVSVDGRALEAAPGREWATGGVPVNLDAEWRAAVVEIQAER